MATTVYLTQEPTDGWDISMRFVDDKEKYNWLCVLQGFMEDG